MEIEEGMRRIIGQPQQNRKEETLFDYDNEEFLEDEIRMEEEEDEARRRAEYEESEAAENEYEEW